MRALGLHRSFPFDQALREHRRFNPTRAIDQQLTDQNGLFGVVGDRALGHVRGDRLIRAGVLQITDFTEARLDFGAAQRLCRHAQRIAQGQSIKGAQGTVKQGHCVFPNCRCSRKCTGSSRLSTCSMKRFCRS
ncbi:hypothetical protein D3C84_877830 [compost metagenome]